MGKANDICGLVELIGRMASSRSGARLGFHEGHVILALHLLREEGPLGRKLLYRKLGITETSARSLVKRLSAHGLASVDRVAGAVLTEKGMEVVNALRENIYVARGGDGVLSGNGYIVALRGIDFADEPVMSIRDMIISRGGAREAVIVYIDAGRGIEVPGLPRSHKLYNVIERSSEDIMRKWGKGTIIYVSFDNTAPGEPYRVAYELLRHKCWRIKYC